MENEVGVRRRKRSIFKNLFSRRPNQMIATINPQPFSLPIRHQSANQISDPQLQQVVPLASQQIVHSVQAPKMTLQSAETIKSWDFKPYPVIYPQETPTSSATCRTNPKATHELKTKIYSTPEGYGSKSILVECKENIDRLRKEWQMRQRMRGYSS
jgi:hypothetical protein